jgi:hypothetical protein
MKSIFSFLMLLSVVSTVNAQHSFRDTIYLKDIYADSADLIACQKVIKIDSLEIIALKERALSWAGITFKNASKVVISNTENQIVIDYIESVSSKIGSNNWQVRIVLEFKKGRIRYQFIDQRNAFWPGSQGVPSSSSGSIYIKKYFDKSGYLKIKGMSHSIWYSIATNWKINVENTAKSLEDYLLKPPSDTKKDDW